MRFRHPDGSTVHLAYCTNVHPAETLEGVVEQLERFCEPVRKSLGWPTLGVGLWLSAPLAQELAESPAAIEHLQAALALRRLEVVTLNGFPYRSFHADVVKLDVYYPDWTDPARLEFTVNLARVLQQLLPADAEYGSISTLPIGWREPVPGPAAIAALKQAAQELSQLAKTGPPIKLALEPEPGCIVETVEQAATVLGAIDTEWLGLCLDACHLAVQFEDPIVAELQLAENGVSIYKAQLSSALKVATPKDADWLADFVEPRFMHQTRESSARTAVLSVDDLDQARAGGLPGNDEWRVHYHVPVHSDDGRTTRDELLNTMKVLVGGRRALTHHLEVETYTWTVLPENQRPTDDAGLVAGIGRELQWTAAQLIELGLTMIGSENES